jgi:hypothetical protein
MELKTCSLNTGFVLDNTLDAVRRCCISSDRTRICALMIKRENITCEYGPRSLLTYMEENLPFSWARPWFLGEDILLEVSMG